MLFRSGSKAVGLSLQALRLATHEVRLVQLRRASGVNALVDEQTRLEDEDTLVLSGSPEHLALVMDELSKGK